MGTKNKKGLEGLEAEIRRREEETLAILFYYATDVVYPNFGNPLYVIQEAKLRALIELFCGCFEFSLVKYETIKKQLIEAIKSQAAL